MNAGSANAKRWAWGFKSKLSKSGMVFMASFSGKKSFYDEA
jgi:hypothetical protein